MCPFHLTRTNLFKKILRVLPDILIEIQAHTLHIRWHPICEYRNEWVPYKWRGQISPIRTNSIPQHSKKEKHSSNIPLQRPIGDRNATVHMESVHHHRFSLVVLSFHHEHFLSRDGYCIHAVFKHHCGRRQLVLMWHHHIHRGGIITTNVLLWKSTAGAVNHLFHWIMKPVHL